MGADDRHAGGRARRAPRAAGDAKRGARRRPRSAVRRPRPGSGDPRPAGPDRPRAARRARPARPGGPRRAGGGGAPARARGYREVAPAPRPRALQEGLVGMSWPTVDLDPVRRLRVLAAAIPGAAVAESVLDAPFDDVWSAATDFENAVPK